MQRRGYGLAGEKATRRAGQGVAGDHRARNPQTGRVESPWWVLDREIRIADLAVTAAAMFGLELRSSVVGKDLSADLANFG
jgi:hypothetical protein